MGRSSGKRRGRSGNGGAKAPRRNLLPDDPVLLSFGSCPRCAQFLASYKVSHGDYSAASSGIEDNWIQLSWDADTCQGIADAYGLDFEVSNNSVQGICPECRRPFIAEADDDAPPTSLSVRLRQLPDS